MIRIYTDGASRNNPGRAGWGAIIIDDQRGTVEEIGGHYPHATNNQMELMGAIEALRFVSDKIKVRGQKIVLFTDSSYVIKGMKQWVHNWQKNDWQTSQKKDVENVNLWKILLELATYKDIDWLYVPGHSNVPLNEQADQIATEYADQKTPLLFSGKITEYFVDASVSGNVPNGGLKSKSSSKASKSGYYIVVQDGKISRYETWALCEKRVKGVRKVRYKKVAHKEEEEEFLKKLGL